MRACVGLGGQAGGAQVFVLQGLLFLEGLGPWRLVADLGGRVRCQFWLAEDSPVHVSVTDHRGVPGKSHGRRSLVGYSPWGHKAGCGIAFFPTLRLVTWS